MQTQISGWLYELPALQYYHGDIQTNISLFFCYLRTPEINFSTWCQCESICYAQLCNKKKVLTIERGLIGQWQRNSDEHVYFLCGPSLLNVVRVIRSQMPRQPAHLWSGHPKPMLWPTCWDFFYKEVSLHLDMFYNLGKSCRLRDLSNLLEERPCS